MPQRDQVFISYSHHDKEWLDKLRTMLRPLERDGRVTVWADSVIKPGEKWKPKIEEALASARAAVLLVSDNFLASEFIAQHELPPLLDAVEKQGVKIIWVAVSHCLYEKTDIRHYHAANNPRVPLDSLPPAEQKKVLAEICNVIDAAVAAKTEQEVAEEQARLRQQEIRRLRVEIKTATDASDWDTAADALEELLKLDPTNDGVRIKLTTAKREQSLATAYLKGDTHLKNDELAEALVEFGRITEQQSDYRDAKLRFDQIQATIEERDQRLRASASSAIQAGDWESAIASLESMLKLHPLDEKLRLELDDFKKKQQLVTSLYNRGLKSLEQSDGLDAALSDFREVKAVGGPFNNLDDLIAETEAKLQKRDEDIQHLVDAADQAIASENWEEAVERLSSARELNGSNENVNSKLELANRQARLRKLYAEGQDYYKNRQWYLALRSFSEIAEEDPRYLDVSKLVPALRRRDALPDRIYFAAAILGIVGIVACLIGLVVWLKRASELQIGAELLVGTAASWTLLLYAAWFAKTNHDDSCLGCFPVVFVIVVPIVTILVLVFAPGYRTRVAKEYVTGAPELIKLKLYDKAIFGLNRSLNINPGDALARSLRGQAHKEKASYDLALRDFNQLIQADNSNDEYLLARAETYLAKGDTKNAFADFDEAVRRWPRANSYYARGSAHLRMKSYALAVDDSTRAITEKPDFAEAFDLLGWAQYQQRDYDRALVALNQAIGNKSGLTVAYFHRGYVYSAKADFESAINDFNTTITRNRPPIFGDPLSQEDLAQAYFERGKAHLFKKQPDYPKAAGDLAEATRLKPENPSAFYYLARAYNEQQDYDSAISNLDKAITIKSDYRNAYSLRCAVRIRKEAYGAAIDDCSKAIQYKGGVSASDYFNRGLAYQLSGNKESARLDFQKVLEFHTPEMDERAKKHLLELNSENPTNPHIKKRK